MVGMAIVAIPSKDSYVWKLSSEKIPHLTILYLGDQRANPDLDLIIQQVKYAAENTLTRFGMTVDRRGELGGDRADVLFFEKNWSVESVGAFRKNLLKYDAIKKAYDSVEQYPEWTPHLTLGYPDRPAKPDEREYPGVHHIEFDSIMVWTEEFGGPEFRLKERHDTVSEVAMSQINNESSERVEDFLAHYGVKGMRWGVRKALGVSGGSGDPSLKYGVRKGRDGAIKPRATVSKKDLEAREWALNGKTEAYAKVYRRASGRIRQGTRALNNDERFKGQDFRKDSPLRRQYYSEYSKMVSNQLNATVSSRSMVAPWRRLGMSPNKRLELRFEFDVSKDISPSATIRRTDTRTGQKDQRSVAKATKKVVKHDDISDDDFDELTVYLVTNTKGYIVDIQAPNVSDNPNEFEHSDELTDFLAHYGVKGMRWGVRRSDAELARASEGGESSRTRRVINRVTGKKKAGGSSKSEDDGDDEKKDSPRLSADAERFVATTQKASSEMSTREIQEAVNRANMVKQYNQLLGTDPNSQLKQQVEALRLRKEYGQLKSELDPPAIERVKSLVSSAKAPYDAYKKLPEPLREEVNGLVAEALGRKGKHTPRHRK